MPLRPEDKVLLDVCCGRWGWSKEFAKRGWKCIGIDLLEHETPPEGCKLVRMNLLRLTAQMIRDWGVTFAVASTPCEEFSVHGLPCFFKNPPYPELGIKLFNHFRVVCREAEIPYVQENVRSAQHFVGEAAVHNCGPFYLWGTAVPMLMPQNIKKNFRGNGAMLTPEFLAAPAAKRRRMRNEFNRKFPTDKKKAAAQAAIIPPELAACVADYAERILEIKYAKEASAVHAEPVRAEKPGAGSRAGGDFLFLREE
jgi:hypothetical protein